MTKHFRANGKLLLTGEYLVLAGAKALVLPLKFGQIMQVNTLNDPEGIHWMALEKGKVWFSASYSTKTLHVEDTTNPELAEKLGNILRQVHKLNPGVFSYGTGLRFETNLEFPAKYGWGSSSTLLSLLAQWAGIDPFDLHFNLSAGSGYDIAAASRNKPFLYSLSDGNVRIGRSRFNYPFKDQVFFAYLGKKQLSDHEVKEYNHRTKPSGSLINRISEIGSELDVCNDLSRFEDLLTEHEEILAEHLERPALKQEKFSDFSGVIKSLGAWGGDFALFVSRQGKKPLKKYLAARGILDIFDMHELFPQTRTVNAPASTL